MQVSLLKKEKASLNTLKDVSIEDLLGRGEVKLSQGEVRSYLRDKNVLVTGAGGSIGSQIVRESSNLNLII